MFRIRTAALTVAPALLLLGSLTACGSDTGGNSASAGAETLRVLVAAPLTGDSADSGNALLHGAELAAAEINKAGGLASGPHKGARIKVEGADDENSTQAATTIANRFVSDDGYFALTGFLLSGNAQSASIVAQRAGLPIVSAFGCSNDLIDKAKNIVVVCASPEANGVAAASFAADQGATTAASVSIDLPQLDFYYDGFKSASKAKGLNWVSKQTYPATATDFSTQVTSALSKKPGAIISGSLQEAAARILNQVREAKSDALFIDMIGEGWSDTFLKIAGQNAVGSYTQDLADAATHKFDSTLADYRAKYGVEMSTAAKHGYDAVRTIADAALRAQSRKDLLQAVRKVDIDGMTGKLSFVQGLRADERAITISRITGTGIADREVVAVYSVASDGSVTKLN